MTQLRLTKFKEDGLRDFSQLTEAERAVYISNDALEAWMDRFGVDVKDRRDAQLAL